MSVTVKQYKDLFEEMKKVYPYNEEKTIVSYLIQPLTGLPILKIETEDEETGVTVIMSKVFDRSDFE